MDFTVRCQTLVLSSLINTQRVTTDHYFVQQLSPLPKLFQRMSEDFVVHRETANVLVLIYQICSLLIQVKSLRNIYLLHIRLPRRRKKRVPNKHTYTPNSTLPSSRGGMVMRHSDIAKLPKKRKSILLISHLCYEQICDSSEMSDRQPASRNALAACSH